MTARAHQLVELIRSTFPVDRSPPNSVQPFPSDPERVELQRVLAGLTWDKLTYAYVEKERSGGGVSEITSMLTPQGFAYYIPAFLVMVLSEKAPDVGNLEFSLYWEFSGQSNPDVMAGYLAFLSGPQKEVVLEVMTYLIGTWQDHPKKKEKSVDQMRAVLLGET